ncbi:DUF2185 domain-containing protein [Lachnospiraceae bacterium 45-W7]
MNRILNEIKRLIDSNLKTYLPHVKISDLEDQGAVFYMNGKDGTEFDWYVNDKLPPFMTFYNDKDNLGAIKLLLYCDGETAVYIYDEKGKTQIKEIHTYLDVSEADILELAVILKNEADDQHIWGADIESIHTDINVTDARLHEFKEHKEYYNTIKNKKTILNLTAYVSKKITEEGWKAGYLERNKPFHEKDSGWSFLAGNESDAYVTDSRNIELVSVANVCRQLDPDVFKYIDMPVGTRLIRISSEAFEIDEHGKEIYMVKR